MSRPCNHWAQFKCNFGDTCGFSHDGPGGADPRGLYQGLKHAGGGGGGISTDQAQAAQASQFLQYAAQAFGSAGGFDAGASSGSFGGGGGGDEPSDNVFITQMPEGLDEDSIKTVMGQYGTVLSVKVVSKPGQTWTACLARFSSVEEAAEIVKQLNGQIPNGLQTPIQVKFADRPRGAGGGGAAGGGAVRFEPYAGGGSKGGGKGNGGTSMDDIIRSIEDSGALPGGDGKSRAEHIEMFILGLPPDCADIHLYKMMSPFGQIGAKGAKVVSDKETGACMGYGFVNFLAQESAEMAIQTLNGAQMPNGKTLRVEQKKAKGEGKGARAA